LTYWRTLVIGKQEQLMTSAARGIIHLTEQPVFSMKHAESTPMPNALDNAYTVKMPYYYSAQLYILSSPEAAAIIR